VFRFTNYYCIIKVHCSVEIFVLRVKNTLTMGTVCAL